ncbi:MAG: hypothetical protein AB7O24_17835 [Kofleriaceae bacterium]
MRRHYQLILSLLTAVAALTVHAGETRAQPGEPTPPAPAAPTPTPTPTPPAAPAPSSEAPPTSEPPPVDSGAPSVEPAPSPATDAPPATAGDPVRPDEGGDDGLGDLVDGLLDAPQALQIHGFVSQGAFLSTANEYIGKSSRGSVAMFEAGLNVSTEVADRLRAGIQLFGRDVGRFRDLPPRLDWAYLDYRWRPWLGMRAGVIKMPFGLYNEFVDVDASRVSILTPQSVYPLRNRSALLAHTGFGLYGNKSIGRAGDLEYQTWFGTLNVPENALNVAGATLDSIDTKYVTGAQAFWITPLEGLRVGGTYIRTSIDFNLTVDPALANALISMGLVPADYDGKLRVSQRPLWLWLASVEYTREDWLFAAEYGRVRQRQTTSLPLLLPTTKLESEVFYGMVTHRLCDWLEAGGYYSVSHADVHDRQGRNAMRFPQRIRAFQRDLTATLRFDVNDHWLWKLEGHFIDGAGDLQGEDNAMPERYWGLFLVKTTVTF